MIRTLNSFFWLDFKRFASYRVDFWMQFLISVLTEMSMAYFLWKAIYNFNHVEVMGGYTFPQMMLYYLVVAFISKIVRSGDEMTISTEIYEGTVTKYLVYPTSYILVRLTSRFSYAILSIAQVFLCLALLPFFLAPQDITITAQSFLVGFAVCLLAMTVYYTVNLALELIAFWQDNVWGLVVMLRFAMLFLGGGYVPLSLFPPWAVKALNPYGCMNGFVSNKSLEGKSWSLRCYWHAP